MTTLKNNTKIFLTNQAGILGGDFYSKAWSLGAVLRTLVGPGQRPGMGLGADPRKLLNFNDFFGVKLALKGDVTPSLKRRNAPLSTFLK